MGEAETSDSFVFFWRDQYIWDSDVYGIQVEVSESPTGLENYPFLTSKPSPYRF
jgi:hypothetical protein